MTWHELVFSDQPPQRFRRHAIFWLAWWVYFVATYFYSNQALLVTGVTNSSFTILIKSFLLLLSHVFIVYAFIYFLLPKFIFKRKYMFFIASLLLAIGITVIWSYLCYTQLFPFINARFSSLAITPANVLLWNSLMAGPLSALKVVAAALVIKLMKRWYFKQKENERLAREKLNVELELLKSQIHPDFLFSSLDNIYLFAQNDSQKASAMLLKLSDLLSYMLYECDKPLVPLEKEIKMLKDYATLEKTKMGERLEMDISVKGETSGKMVVPLLLLPFIEYSFHYCANKKLENPWINLDIRVEENDLMIKIINGKQIEEPVSKIPEENGLANVQKRLYLLYPNNSELRIHAEPEVMMTYLKINMDILPQQDQTETGLKEFTTEQIPNYA